MLPVARHPALIDLFRGDAPPVDDLLTGTLALDDINPVFESLHEGKAVRQVVML